MKFIIATLLVVFSFHAHAVIENDQTENVLKHLDQACGDSWCEGFFDIEFAGMRCSRGASLCKIEMTFSQTGNISPQSVVCVVKQVRFIDDLLKNAGTASERPTANLLNEINGCVESFYARFHDN